MQTIRIFNLKYKIVRILDDKLHLFGFTQARPLFNFTNSFTLPSLGKCKVVSVVPMHT